MVLTKTYFHVVSIRSSCLFFTGNIALSFEFASFCFVVFLWRKLFSNEISTVSFLPYIYVIENFFSHQKLRQDNAPVNPDIP